MTRALSLDAPIAPDVGPSSVEESVEIAFRKKLIEDATMSRNGIRTTFEGVMSQACERFRPLDRFMETCECGRSRVAHDERQTRRWVEWSSQQGRRLR